MNIIGIIIAIAVVVILCGFLFGGAEGGALAISGCAVIILSLGLSFLIISGLVWCVCHFAIMAGFTSIGNWTVAFSWPLAAMVWFIYLILHGIFSVTVHKS